MTKDERRKLEESGYCTHGNRPPCNLCVEAAEKDEEPEPESLQERSIARSKTLIEHVDGSIDTNTAAYKQFDESKYERFFIQKGELAGSEVVFKVGETANSDRLVDESRNLKVLEAAESKLDSPLDIHIVRQVGELFEDGEMTGFATEYLEDDPEAKAALTSEQKVEIIGRVIEGLQKLDVTDQVLSESGLGVCDAENISRDGQYFVSTLKGSGYFNDAMADRLTELFRAARADLADEKPVFVHGDAHGDNIFVQKKEEGEFELSLIDIEGLRISTQYHDWSEILNKAAFLQHVEQTLPDQYVAIAKNVKDMWLNGEVRFDEDEIVQKVTKGDPQQVKNFRLTRIFDMLSRAMITKQDGSPFAKARVELFNKLIAEQVEKIG